MSTAALSFDYVIAFSKNSSKTVSVVLLNLTLVVDEMPGWAGFVETTVYLHQESW